MLHRWKRGPCSSPSVCRYPRLALLALDVTGDRADVPALAMTLLEGRPVWETRWGSKWVSQAVDAIDPASARYRRVPNRTARVDHVRPRSAMTHHDGQEILRCGNRPSRSSIARYRPRTSGSSIVTSTRATCCGSETG